jgi:hypothetical protein
MSTTTPKDLGALGSGNEIERVRRVIISTPWNKPYEIRADQEKFVEVGGEVKHKDKAKSIRRKFDDVKDESVTFDGVTATVEQIAGLIQTKLDEWRVEDAGA